ncbi:fluoride efflux transporter CrcB [Bacillaceae bacterium]
MLYVIIAAMGALGALLRYYTGLAAASVWPMEFPLATLLVNVVGCFVLGWFSRRVTGRNAVPEWFRAGITIGLLGSFTTFSAFSWETVALMQRGWYAGALSYVFLSLAGGLGSAWLGVRMAERRWAKREKREKHRHE